MSPIRLALESEVIEVYPWDIQLSEKKITNFFGCKQFLLSILLRAVFDAVMYPPDDDRAVSAREWLEGEVESYIDPATILELIGQEDLVSLVKKISSDPECDYAQVAKKLRGHLYSRGKDIS